MDLLLQEPVGEPDIEELLSPRSSGIGYESVPALPPAPADAFRRDEGDSSPCESQSNFPERGRIGDWLDFSPITVSLSLHCLLAFCCVKLFWLPLGLLDFENLGALGLSFSFFLFFSVPGVLVGVKWLFICWLTLFGRMAGVTTRMLRVPPDLRTTSTTSSWVL